MNDEQKYLYYMIDIKDKLELPISPIFDSIKDLAEFTGYTVGGIQSQLSRFKNGKIKKCKFIKVKLI